MIKLNVLQTPKSTSNQALGSGCNTKSLQKTSRKKENQRGAKESDGEKQTKMAKENRR